jgi:hypothetical protein
MIVGSFRRYSLQSTHNHEKQSAKYAHKSEMPAWHTVPPAIGNHRSRASRHEAPPRDRPAPQQAHGAAKNGK